MYLGYGFRISIFGFVIFMYYFIVNFFIRLCIFDLCIWVCDFMYYFIVKCILKVMYLGFLYLDL